MDPSYYEKNGFLQKLPNPGRIYHPVQAEDAFQTLSGNNLKAAYENQKRFLAPNMPLCFGLEEVSYANPVFLESFLRWYLFLGEIGHSQKLLDYLDVAYVFDNSPRTRDLDGDGPLFFRETKTPFPKWFCVETALPGHPGNSSRTSAMELPENFQKQCVISDPSHAGRFAPRKVSEISRTPCRLGLEALGKGRALLVSSETDYPGWMALVGASWRPLESVNGGFRGLILEDGEDHAILTYRPVSFRLGCFLSLLACSFWAALIFRLVFSTAKAREET
jgi:hypothetical protein